MLEVWKIQVPSQTGQKAPGQGWALAETESEALGLANHPAAEAQRMPEHLWIAKERIIWTVHP